MAEHDRGDEGAVARTRRACSTGFAGERGAGEASSRRAEGNRDTAGKESGDTRVSVCGPVVCVGEVYSGYDGLKVYVLSPDNEGHFICHPERNAPIRITTDSNVLLALACLKIILNLDTIRAVYPPRIRQI